MGLHNLARMTTGTVGTGAITLGVNVAGFLTFAAAGVTDGESVSYGIVDGLNVELGYGTYTASGTVLARTTILTSTNGGAAISLSGSAQVFLTILAQDIPSNMSHVVLAPSSGFTQVLSNVNTVFNPSVAITSGTNTITMHAAPTDGWVYSICATKQISPITWNGNSGQTVIDAPTFLAPGTTARFIWDNSSATWYPI